MKELKKTTVAGFGKTAHYHVAYLNDETGQGFLTTALGHSHEVQYQPSQPEVPATPDQQDPQTGEMIPANPGSPATPAEWLISPGDDGHTHALIDYVIKVKKSKEKDEDIIDDVISLWRTASDIEGNSIKQGHESDDFYFGDQWEDGMSRELIAADRACLTINLTQKQIETLSGHQRQNRTDFKFIPMEGGDQRVSDLLNVLTKQITEHCYFPREESKVFLDQVIPGRGIFNVYMDFAKDLEGDVVIERYPWHQFRAGAHEKEDLSDCEYICKDRWYSINKIKQLWEDKADQVEEGFDNAKTLLDRHSDPVEYQDDPYGHSTNRSPVDLGNYKLLDISKKQYRVIECWRKVFKIEPVVVNITENFFDNCYGWEKKDLDAIKEIPGFYIVNKPTMKMRISKVVQGVLLSDEDPADLPIHEFFTVPVYAKKRGDRFQGKVEPLKDLQRDINKRHSQSIDIVNKMSAYGYFIDEGMFPDGEKEKFINNSSRPGFVSVVNDAGRIPVKSEGINFPSEIVQLQQLSYNKFNELSSVIVEKGGANESGSARLQKQKEKLQGDEYLFDNLSFAKSQVGRLLVPLIAKYYSPERIMRIVSHRNQKYPVEIAGTPYSNFTEEEIIDLLSSTDLEKYDVIVAESSTSPSARMAVNTTLMEMQANGAQVPIEAIIKTSDIPEDTKQEILKSIQEANAAAAQSASTTSDTEIQKTLIAQGMIPPAVAEKYGVQAPGQPTSPTPQQGIEQGLIQNNPTSSLAG